MIHVKNTIQLWHRRRLTKWFCWIFSLFAGKSGAPAPPQCTASSGTYPQLTSCDLISVLHLWQPPLLPPSHPQAPPPGPARDSQPTLPSPPATTGPHTVRLTHPPHRERALRLRVSGQSALSLRAPLRPLAHEAFPAPPPPDPQHTGQQPSCKGPPWLPSLKLGGVCDQRVSVWGHANVFEIKSYPEILNI